MKALVFLTVGCLAHFREMLEDALVSEFTEAHDEILAKFVGSFSGLHFPKMEFSSTRLVTCAVTAAFFMDCNGWLWTQKG